MKIQGALLKIWVTPGSVGASSNLQQDC
jgi:hypothetical protein